MPSIVAAGCCGTNSESSMTVLLPPSVFSSALLPLGVPPRKMQFLNVMLLPVTFTYPWKSLPLMTWPLVWNVWLPLTIVSWVPGTTPVLLGPGLPVRGFVEVGAGLGVGGPDFVGDAVGVPDALAAPLGLTSPLAPGAGCTAERRPTCADASGWAHAARIASAAAPTSTPACARVRLRIDGLRGSVAPWGRCCSTRD